MIIEMTYGEWRTIHELLGVLPVEELTERQIGTAIKLRERIRDHKFDN